MSKFGVALIKRWVSAWIMKIARPNKFEWKYDSQGNNVGQIMISDGKNVYIVDKELEAKLLANDPRGFSLFKVEPAKDLNYSTLSDSSKLRSGQTLVFLGEGVSRDIFSKQDKFSLPAEEGTEPISFDIIKVAKSISETPALVLDLDGDVVGFTVMIGEKSLILPSNLIKESLKI